MAVLIEATLYRLEIQIHLLLYAVLLVVAVFANKFYSLCPCEPLVSKWSPFAYCAAPSISFFVTIIERNFMMKMK